MVSSSPSAVRVVYPVAPCVSYGVELTFETLLAEQAADAPTRVLPDHDTLLRVIAGSVRLTIDGEARVLGTGDEAIVPAATAHRLQSAVGKARIVSGLRARRR